MSRSASLVARCGATAAAALLLASCAPAPTTQVPEAIADIMAQPTYEGGRWGLSVVDVETGEVLAAVAPEERFATGSTAKLLTVTAALAELGPGHVFETPVFALGQVSGGVLDGDLVLRGVGDLTLGGRTAADGTIDVPTFDHTDANALPGNATLTPEDLLAGLDALATQVAAAGVTRVAGDVLVDDRLWDAVEVDGVPISPIAVNDNLVDFLITPGDAVGDAATFTWRPVTAAYRPALAVTTGAADSAIDLTVEADGSGALLVSGSVPLGASPVVWTSQVEEPADWARALFIEALERAGVAVDADLAAAPGPLPAAEALEGLEPIARLASPPLSETVRLINKVSHNLGANQLPLVLAAQRGGRTLEDGAAAVLETLAAAGLAGDDLTYTDGQGLAGDTITPEAMTRYLRHLISEPWFDVVLDSTPVLGVDGSLADVLPDGDPGIGAAHAKTGTLAYSDEDGSLVLETKALAGYVDTAAGRRLAFAVFVNDVPLAGFEGIYQANRDLGAIASWLYQLY